MDSFTGELTKDATGVIAGRKPHRLETLAHLLRSGCGKEVKSKHAGTDAKRLDPSAPK
jgi:hypothetical protein